MKKNFDPMKIFFGPMKNEENRLKNRLKQRKKTQNQALKKLSL